MTSCEPSGEYSRPKVPKVVVNSTADPRWCLRSDALKPNYDYYSPDDPTLWNDSTIIQSVVEHRHRATAGTEIPSPSTDLHGGRLLLCYYDETNHNEGSAYESRWFYDGNDNPAWDTWVACLDDALISWVPPQFLDLAAEGMAVECCQMLMWIENPLSYILDDKPRQIPGWLKRYSWTTSAEGTLIETMRADFRAFGMTLPVYG